MAAEQSFLKVSFAEAREEIQEIKNANSKLDEKIESLEKKVDADDARLHSMLEHLAGIQKALDARTTTSNQKPMHSSRIFSPKKPQENQLPDAYELNSWI